MLQHAIGYVDEGEFYGAKALLNVWKPTVIGNDFSLSQIWVLSNIRGRLANSIEAGWHVNPSQNSDGLPRLFTFWADPKSENWWLKVGNEVIG
ncbi:putative neprosin [Helianthus annuus]|nr:putative neprosin [Helianthus annuus]